MDKFLICVLGPTAIGKTELAIKIAQHFGTEILSADSRQFFKEMSIGTAKPSDGELRAAKHHFINNLSVKDKYSVGDYETEALKIVETIFETHNTAVLAGGSGLYVNAVVNGFDNFPEVDKSVRDELIKSLEENGLEYLQNLLKQEDLAYYKEVDIQNPQRVIRALEVSLTTGKPFSSYRNKDFRKRNFKTVKIGLNSAREKLYDRINLRVDLMMQGGLLDEVKLLHHLKSLNALQTVGYSELFEFVENRISLDEAIAQIKQNTRRFAKRQLTWFRKDEQINWFEPDEMDKIIEFIETQLTPER